MPYTTYKNGELGHEAWFMTLFCQHHSLHCYTCDFLKQATAWHHSTQADPDHQLVSGILWGQPAGRSSDIPAASNDVSPGNFRPPARDLLWLAVELAKVLCGCNWRTFFVDAHDMSVVEISVVGILPCLDTPTTWQLLRTCPYTLRKQCGTGRFPCNSGSWWIQL